MAPAESSAKEAFMAEDRTTPEQAAPEPEGRRQPYGPGLLLFFGLVCLALGAYCLYDLFGSKGTDWEAKGDLFSIWSNRAALVLGAAGAIYLFVLAAVRSKKPPAGDASGGA
jgi:hypothetical protein